MKILEARKLDRKSGGSPSIALRPRLKAVEEDRLRPTYAGANVGHPELVVAQLASLRVDLTATRIQ
jgi:hypothetical protein